MAGRLGRVGFFVRLDQHEANRAFTLVVAGAADKQHVGFAQALWPHSR